MLELVEVLAKLREVVDQEAVVESPEYGRGIAATVTVRGDGLVEVAELFREEGFYVESIAGLDFLDGMEVVYHFSRHLPKNRMAVRVRIHHGESVPSISSVFKSALWQEREVWEFFGIPFQGHPDLRPLLLPEDADFYPLRKDFGRVHAYRKREEIYG